MKALDIERLLIWAYCEELPKREFLGLGLSNFSIASDLARLAMETIDDGRPITNRYAELYRGGPHADAVLVEQHVLALNDHVLRLHDEPAVLVADMPSEVQAGAAEALDKYRVEIVALVIRCARLRSRPPWRCEIPQRKPWSPEGRPGRAPWFIKVKVRGAFGKMGEVERLAKLNPRSRRYPPTAYQKFVWVPDIASVVEARADWLVWRGALEHLAESLAGHLHERTLSSLRLPWMPWLAGAEHEGVDKPRILPALAVDGAGDLRMFS